MSRAGIFAEIEAERAYQQERWGNEFDDTHTPSDWWTFVSLYFAKSLPHWKNKYEGEVDYRHLRKGLVKVATIVVAWIESIDRKEES